MVRMPRLRNFAALVVPTPGTAVTSALKRVSEAWLADISASSPMGLSGFFCGVGFDAGFVSPLITAGVLAGWPVVLERLAVFAAVCVCSGWLIGAMGFFWVGLDRMGVPGL